MRSLRMVERRFERIAGSRSELGLDAAGSQEAPTAQRFEADKEVRGQQQQAQSHRHREAQARSDEQSQGSDRSHYTALGFDIGGEEGFH